MIAATIAAYETFCRVCDMRNLKPLGFDHSTIGCMASTVAAARLMGLNEAQSTEAVNLAVASNIALFQTRIGKLSMWKACAFANASRNAVFAAQLAKLGMTGPSPVFEGQGGYFHAVTREAYELAPFGGAGQPFRIKDCLIKRFPLGQYAQSVAEATLMVRERIADPGEISEVLVETLGTAVKLMAGDPEKWRPANSETADHSMPYAVAVALMHGAVERRYFEEPYIHDARLLELTGRVQCTAWDEADRREWEAMPCRITVTTRSGQRHSVAIDYHRGHYRNPMSDAEIEAKFRSLAEEPLGRVRCDVLLDRLWHLEQVPDAGRLLDLTRI